MPPPGHPQERPGSSLSSEDAAKLWKVLVDGVRQTVAPPRPPTADELADYLPYVARALYDYVEKDELSEEFFFELIRWYAAEVAEMRVREMLSSGFLPSKGRSWERHFALFAASSGDDG